MRTDLPVLVRMWVHDGDNFRLHLHLIPAAGPEVTAQRCFCDALRANPAPVTAYAERRRAVLADRPVGATGDNRGKAAFIRPVMRGNADADREEEPRCRGE